MTTAGINNIINALGCEWYHQHVYQHKSNTKHMTRKKVVFHQLPPQSLTQNKMVHNTHVVNG